MTTQGEIVWSAVYKSYGNLAIDYQTVPNRCDYRDNILMKNRGYIIIDTVTMTRNVHVTLVKTRLV